MLLLIVSTWTFASDEDPWAMLREGGKVILMRHAPVEPGPDSGDPLVRDPSCRLEKNLSALGRQQAEAIGRLFVENGIPVFEARHSPFCRTAETARLAFGDANPAGYLSLIEVLEPTDAERQTVQLLRVIGAHSEPGNLVLITHEPNISPISFELVKHLDMVVLEPKGGEAFEELGLIRFEGQSGDE